MHDLFYALEKILLFIFSRFVSMAVNGDSDVGGKISEQSQLNRAKFSRFIAPLALPWRMWQNKQPLGTRAINIRITLTRFIDRQYFFAD